MNVAPVIAPTAAAVTPATNAFTRALRANRVIRRAGDHKKVEITMTKYIGVLLAASAVAALTVPVPGTFAQPKGDKVTISGEVVDTWCYLEGGDHGAAHAPAPRCAPRPAMRSRSWMRKARCT